MARARRGGATLAAACARALVLVTLLVGHAHAADANEAESRQLRLVYDAPAECPDRDAFVRAVRARTPRPRFAEGDEAEHAITLRIAIEASSSGGTSGRLDLREPDGTEETRRVTSRTCDEVVNALALIAAVMLDPDARAGAEPFVEPPPASVPSPSPGPPPPATHSDRRAPTPTPPEPRSPWRLGAGVELGARGGIGPAVAPTAGAFIDVEQRGRLFALAARLSFDVARTSSDLRGGDHTYEWVGWTLRLCPVHLPLPGRLRISPCGAMQIAGHRGTSRDVPGASSHVALWLAPIVDAGLEWETSSTVSLELRGVVVFPLRRTRFFLAPDSTIFEVPAAAGNVELGARIRFL